MPKKQKFIPEWIIPRGFGYRWPRVKNTDGALEIRRWGLRFFPSGAKHQSRKPGEKRRAFQHLFRKGDRLGWSPFPSLGKLQTFLKTNVSFQHGRLKKCFERQASE